MIGSMWPEYEDLEKEQDVHATVMRLGRRIPVKPALRGV